MTDPEYKPTFWAGGFVGLASAFMAGVMLTLMLMGIAVNQALAAERLAGKCVVACQVHGFRLSWPAEDGSTGGQRCLCARIGEPDRRVVVQATLDIPLAKP